MSESRQYRGKEHETRLNKQSSTASSNITNSSAIYQQIRLHMNKFFDQQKKQTISRQSKRQSLRQDVSNRPTININYDNSQMKTIKPFVNNFTQLHIKQHNSSNILQHGVMKQERATQNTPKKNSVQSNISNQLIQKKHFSYQYIIGKGGFGKVWKVEHKRNRCHFAVKQMLKSIVLSKKSVLNIINEKKILKQLKGPHIVNMYYAFQDRQSLYLVLDLLQGGDLRHHLSSNRFNEIQSKFFIACLIQSLQYIHKDNVIHRDIKPQNLVLDSKGYMRVTDFGIASIYRESNSSDTSGTPGYMCNDQINSAPEVICRQNHSFTSDFFAVGVISYELMLGKRPYNGSSRSEIRENILARQASVKISQLPNNWSIEAMDFVNKLLQRKPQQRLGYNGIQEIKRHPWLANINWKKLFKQQIEAPYIPNMKKSDFDQDQQITIEDEQEGELIEKNAFLLRRQQFQDLFKQYYYCIQQQTKKAKPKKQEKRKYDRKQKMMNIGGYSEKIREKTQKNYIGWEGSSNTIGLHRSSNHFDSSLISSTNISNTYHNNHSIDTNKSNKAGRDIESFIFHRR